MLTLGNLIIYFFEGLAVSAALYLLARRQLGIAEMVIMALSISVTFMILDLFAPGIATGARQGAGFGLGFRQVAGGPYPKHYYGGDQPVVEGMDDPAAVAYYQRYNPSYQNQSYQNQLPKDSQMQYQSNQQVQHPVDPQIPSPILNKLQRNPFDTTVKSFTEIESPGAIFDAENIPQTTGEAETAPLIYSPLKPTYGYRYQFPRGWDELEQDNLHKTFNNQHSQPVGYEGNYVDSYQYQKKNI